MGTSLYYSYKQKNYKNIAYPKIKFFIIFIYHFFSLTRVINIKDIKKVAMEARGV